MTNIQGNIQMQWGDTQNDGEELICGINNDCIILQPKHHNAYSMSSSSMTNDTSVMNNGVYEQSSMYPSGAGMQLDVLAGYNTVEENVSDLHQPIVQDFVEIQVTEEEVISDNWSLDHTGVVVADVKPRIDTGQANVDEVEIPLPQDQDLYSQMHPFPCDFCSRRFSKKSTLMSHMVSHKSSEDLHDCNLCGAKYRRKCDLVNHMKIHAYAPDRSTMEDDDDDFPRQNQPSNAHKGRRKKSLVPKKNSVSSTNEFSPDHFDMKAEKKSGKHRMMKKGNKISTSKTHNYVDEDMRLLSEMSRNADIVHQVPRWPVVDQSRPYVCQHCGVGFAREKALASHSRIHAGDSPFECDVCGEMFWDVTLLREHGRAKHPHLDASPAGSVYTGDDRFGNFFCEICGVAFHRMDLLKRHRRSHVKAEPLQEVSDDDHVCTVCGIFFESAMELRTHAETHRTEHRCMACGQNFDDASTLSDHVRRCHNTEQSQEKTCTLCGKICKDRRSLQKHSCVHSENRSFPCYACNKRFHSRARLRRHMMSHRDKAVVCSDCGDEFPDGRALLSHRHSHNASSNSLPARSFPCHDCGKTFGSRSSQQIHVRIHTGERPYGCRFCWKAFADGGTLRKHERIHTGEKPYVCPVCPKAFNQRVVLREHIRAHHSGADSKVNSCYECKVCGYLFGSSSELCLHLVQHSDENTAKHRQPSLGPRKYKRRRKLIAHDIPNISPMPDDDESTDSSDSHVEKKKIINKKKYRSEPNQTAQDLETVVKQCESALQNINSMVIKSEPKEKKLKIDKTLKKHKTKNMGKLFKIGRNEKRAKAAKLLNNTSYASKYVVSRPDDLKPHSNNEQVRPRTKNVTYPLLDDLMDSINGSDGMRNRPRTKNVNFRNLTVTKLEPATFPVTKTRKKSKSRKSGGRKQKSETTVMNGSNQINSYSKSGMVSEENLETCIVPDFNIEGIKTEIPNPEETTILPMDSCIVKSELITCEMCTELFADRTQLLNHIRIHI